MEGAFALGGWGATISGAGHAAAIALALWALPWLRAGPDPGVPVVAVRLVAPSELSRSELSRPERLRPELPPPEPPAASAPAPTATRPGAVLRPEATVPHEEAPAEAPPVEGAPVEGFAGRFDPAAPLGIELADPGAEVPGAEAPGADVPGADGAVPEAGLWQDAAEPPEPGPSSVEAFGAALRAAVERAKVYPRAARERGLYGTTQVALQIGPAGEVVALRLLRSSGAKALDDAALAAVRAARLPAPPAGAPLAYDLGISFTRRDN